MKQIKRNSHSFKLLTILLLAVLGSAVSNAAPITVGNPSFEVAGDVVATGWYALPASGDWVDGNGTSAYEIYDVTENTAHFTTAADGNRVLNLQPATTMKQDLTIPVTINDIISMTFYVGDSFKQAPAFISTAFTLDGVNASPTSQVSNTTGDGTWQQKTVQWTATSAGNLGISFASGAGGWIDNVSVDYTFVPEPSTAILAGLGLAGMCLRRRKRK